MADGLRRGKKALMRPVDAYEARLNRESGIPVKICAQMAGVSRATLLRELAKLRKKLGPEKLPNERRARSHLGRLNTSNS